MEQSQTYYTIPEVAQILRVSRATVYSFLGRDGGLAVTKFGKCTRVHRDDLEAFQRAQRGRHEVA